MKQSIFSSLVVVGLVVGSQQLVSENIDSERLPAAYPEAGMINQSLDAAVNGLIVPTGNVPCNPAKQVCEE